MLTNTGKKLVHHKSAFFCTCHYLGYISECTDLEKLMFLKRISYSVSVVIRLYFSTRGAFVGWRSFPVQMQRFSEKTAYVLPILSTISASHV